jgi:hypothetical protein
MLDIDSKVLAELLVAMEVELLVDCPVRAVLGV